MRRYLETGKAVVLGRRIDMMALRADGSEFPIELAIIAVPNKSRRSSPVSSAT